MKKLLVLFFIVNTIISSAIYAQGNSKFNNDSGRLDWFQKAKFGIFMHWGVYSAGYTSESWPFFNGTISYQDYIGNGKEFTAKNFNADEWANLFTKIGARYVVLTAMHCDGIALWDTKVNNKTIRNTCPCDKDLIAEYSTAMQKAGLKTGLYYSHVDWSNQDYMGLTQSMTKKELDDALKVKYKFSNVWNERSGNDYYTNKKFSQEEAVAWSRFINGHDQQIAELLSNYGKIDLLWFDFMYPNAGDFKWGEKELKQQLLQKYPSLVINDRMGKSGDYHTAERGFPVVAPQGPWEYCETLSDRWGYMPTDTIYKSSRQLVRILSECISLGGNFLLDFGPKADGTFDPQHVKRLLEVGLWVNKNKEAVYETKRGLLPGHFYGPTALSGDSKTLFLYLFDDPKEGIQIKGIRNKVKQASVLGYPNQPLKTKRLGGADWANIPGSLSIDIPHELLDDKVTVVKIEFDRPIDLYREKGRDIVNN